MTRIYNDPADFKEEVIEGFAAAYARYVQRVPNASGFIRKDGPRAGKVSLVIGGGSGHYPSYSGVTGPGFADGCVLGDVFTSPSNEQVYRICRAASGGGGLMLSFGNYAGDRLNFAAAQERLVAEGIDTRIVYVTDDVASAKAEDRLDRRGIAGTFTVYKIAGAAADLGEDLDTVERVMLAANAATFSCGVAFEGCTFPGQKEPLFHVDEDTIEFGLGIHGEPGISSAASMPAVELASALVERLLEERPEGTDGRAAVILNGLGATKYEELFLLYGHVFRLLEAAGVRAVLPEVGELVTSLDMAGCSLSLTWLDDELERYWTAPADTASFKRGNVSELPAFEAADTALAVGTSGGRSVEASEDSRAAAVVARSAIAAMRDVVLEHEEELGRIDAVAGDGDHGVGMARGTRAASVAAEEAEGGLGAVLAAAGDAFADKAGGTSGILWGILLSAVGVSLGDTDEVTPDRLRTAVRHGAETVQRIGKAQMGDKTLLDSLMPFVDELDTRVEAGDDLAPAWETAAEKAVTAAEATRDLTPEDRPGPAARRTQRRHPRRRGHLDGNGRRRGWDGSGRVLRASDRTNGTRTREEREDEMTSEQPRFRLVVGSDSAGFEYKEAILADLREDPRVIEVEDLGVHEGRLDEASYGEVAITAGTRIRDGLTDRAILVCGTGIGVAIGANKVQGIRATVAHDSFSVERSILSNNCQVLTFGQRVIGLQLARRLAKEWLGYTFDPSSPSNEKVAVISGYETSKPD